MNTVENKMIVIVHYTVSNDRGETLFSSYGGDPIPYLHGAKNIVPGLENALTGLKVGDSIEVNVHPAEAYGLPDTDAYYMLPRKIFEEVARDGDVNYLDADGNIKIGERFIMKTAGSDEQMLVWIHKVDDEFVTVTRDHKLVGQVLHFTASVINIRQPTLSEIAHGHAHGLEGFDEDWWQ